LRTAIYQAIRCRDDPLLTPGCCRLRLDVPHRPVACSLMQRQVRPEAFGRRRGGYIDRRRDRTCTVAAASAVAQDSAWHEQRRVIGSQP
jgi:hypothetical protein